MASRSADAGYKRRRQPFYGDPLSGDPPPAPAETDTQNESEKERIDRNFLELLQELRVAQTGVQVLFAFLLAVPFAASFDKLDEFQRTVYFITLICTAISTALLIAPSAHHRIEFRRREKEHILKVANRMAIVGFGFLALAMVGVVLLISDFMYSPAAATAATAGAAVMFAWLWYWMPIQRLRRGR
jgi:Family of unknown function (DUF6328)